MSEAVQVGWKVDGEFITQLAREWLWLERKPYEKVEELLLSCLVTDQITDAEKRDIAQQILEGRKKLVGINIFTLEKDGENIRPLSELLQKTEVELDESMNSMVELAGIIQERANRLEENERQRKLNKIKDCMKASNMLFPLDIQLRDVTQEDLNLYCETYNLVPSWVSWGGNSWIQFYRVGDDNACTLEYLRKIGALYPRKEERERVFELEMEDPQSWGWLSPTGEFMEGDFGDHESVAQEIVKSKGFEEDYEKWWAECKRSLHLCRDYLIEVKGYVLLHNPTGLPNTLATYSKPLTKAQREFLYDYYIKEGEPEKASSFFQEED